MSCIVRPMVAADLLAVEDIQAEAYSGYFLEPAEVIAQRFILSPTTAWVAVVDGSVCAYLVGYWSSLGKINPLHAVFVQSASADCLYLHDLALLKSAQGKGMAKQLIEVAFACASRNAARAVALLSVQNSKRFWQGFGFSEYPDVDSVQQKNLQTYLAGDSDLAFYMVKKI